MIDKYKTTNVEGMTMRLYHGTSSLDPRIVLKSVEGFDLKFNTRGIHG